MTAIAIPREFIWRRLHSLTGLWLVLFLMEHLLANSQAALWIGDSGKGFVDMVNSIHNLPFLQAIEIFLLGVPFLIHAYWGVKYALTSKSNSKRSDGSKPSLPELKRNKAYSWQRITSWIVLVILIFHVVKFRFLDYPTSCSRGSSSAYFVKVSLDDGLYTVADRLNVKLYNAEEIAQSSKDFGEHTGDKALVDAAEEIREKNFDIFHGPKSGQMDAQKAVILTSAQQYEIKAAWVKALSHYSLGKGEVVAEANDFGTASLLSVRNTFKCPIYAAIYTIFVLATCFHAFNGLWTFLITWGIVLKMTAQKKAVAFCLGLMTLIIFLGLASIWGTYWANLRY